MKIVVTYLLIITAIGIALTIWDKKTIKRRAMRVPESVLFLFAALGGSLGMYITMLIIRHKTRHKSFMLGFPLIMLLQIMVLLFFTWMWTEKHI